MRRPSRGSEMAEAKSWAHHLVQRDNWLVLDVETTDLGANAEIVEVAIVGPGGDTLLDTIVRPRTVPTAGAVRVHGLSSDILCRACPFESIYRDLVGLLAGRIIVGYNVVFDLQALNYTCHIAGLAPISCTWECAMFRYEQWRGFRTALVTACEIESIFVEAPRHRALPDAQLAWQLIRRMAGFST